MTLRASGSLMVGRAGLAHGGEGRGHQHDGLHVGEQRVGLAEKVLPGRLLGEARAGFRAVLEVAEAPEMHELVQGAELGEPEAFLLAVLVAADLAADVAGELEVLRLGARRQRVGPELVDHGLASFTDRADAACPPRRTSAAGAPPSPGAGGCAADPDGPRSGSPTCRSTRAPSHPPRARRRARRPTR